METEGGDRRLGGFRGVLIALWSALPLRLRRSTE
jgi:hypothetical protein